jgi:hypothetical protein
MYCIFSEKLEQDITSRGLKGEQYEKQGSY